MTSINGNKNSNLSQDNWADDLLVKDSSGKFYTLKDGSNKSVGSAMESINQLLGHKSEDEAVSFDDSFVPLKSNGSGQETAEFAFHPDDKKQIEDLSSQIPQDSSKKYSINKIVDRLINKQDLKLDSHNHNYFTNIIYDFFRNRKKASRVRELLGVAIVSDNKKLSEETVDSIISVIKGIKNKIDSVGGLIVKTEELAKIEEPLEKDKQQPPPISVSSTIKADEPPAKSQSFKFDYSDDQKEKPITKIQPSKEPETFVKSPISIKPEELSRERIADSLPHVFRPAQEFSKKKMTDVNNKFRPAAKIPILTGPVQELHDFTLDNFRRLGNSAEERIDKILEKINVLEQDSITKKAQGIENWRKSEVYKTYLKLGVESMSKNEEVAALIRDYQKQGIETLSLEEFSAISDLNKLLRF
ncbi:MAG: hypothetical protein COV55_02625 [Candidatus Komeilibacteria bacterium CG11_big_fil_rev_8_21_14_0_20_36_20]|uniref:Uncharacterized protein n=1 Tax=Candidatus Komeilibacteria bacterium CG11_big_fil_rev_8_21_14_0_20_36_20 TaxID=1974477 RepID=A0A2H0NCX7_9BACT|nr:MAG: hypothetical protein COV55_02625 [Candidatus Komeilibacteria bacterium CG11_big_fil_rev_8_21_14_0_20_36_20]PIR81502.1 MAG: hypothetical protein COU21_03285 [Candidatus Komeilibacteria bacterium CG10_big_fil_rev_8_21_14_0_10_36_65]PJC55722.1 MAG: hypothetical protein CO027_00535 [Candidatus Komeilibacteria bacterium CG_4_9_14_0_2_um_filter_36_13]